MIPRASQVGMGTVSALKPAGRGGSSLGAASDRSIAAISANARAKGVKTV